MTGAQGDRIVHIPQPAALARRRKRPDVIADAIRDKIMQSDLQPGDRVPTEWLADEALRASRGTLREAMTILEFQGLITTRTGPGGGAFVTAVDTTNVLSMLNNLFLFEPPSIADIYALRKFVEPELAALAAREGLSDAAFEALQATVRLYEAEPRSASEEYRQRLAELDFHAELARMGSNKLLGFIAVFLLNLLRDMTVCREIYQQPNPRLRRTGLHYQVQLLRAIRAGESEKARTLMHDHMVEAEAYMLERAAMRTRPESSGERDDR
ncbi:MULTISPECIES: FCD domain-containing protein [unclassified Roseitalea]|uniref:FadR/GntR family transcriptional regulator n=1 Tax=unclassified Roseitalea TaxID=2639107 RepID=UPI00273FA48C|nr:MULTISPECIES: FCD domain-containing protein [unclassified Roseitalea]